MTWYPNHDSRESLAGRAPKPRDILLRPGEVKMVLAHRTGETVDEALARAQATMPWGPRIRRRFRPRLAGKYWLFAVSK